MSLVGKKFRKNAVIEVVAETETGYLVQNAGNPEDRWEVPKGVFEQTYVVVPDTGVSARCTQRFPRDLTEIVKQLKCCKFHDEIEHPLESNIAFVTLEEMAREQQSKISCSASVQENSQ
jgi:hypothetical protein